MASQAHGTVPPGMAQSTRIGGGASRVEKKLKQSLDERNYYEAHQMYRTLYSRYSAQERHNEVQILMQDGAYLLFSVNENGSAVDLSLLFLDSLETSKAQATEKLIDTVGDLHKKIGITHPQHQSFEVKAITWTTHTEGVPKTGHLKLRGIFAHNLWQEKQFDGAREHFLYSDDGAGSGEMLVEFSISHGKEEEIDLFIAQFVLQLLCIRSKQVADQAFTTYIKKHPKCENSHPFGLPLLNYIFFLLVAIENRSPSTFATLCEQYHPSLKRDPSYFKYLERIGENFFGLQFPKRKKPMGLFGSIIQGLMESPEDDDDDFEGSVMEPDATQSTSHPVMTVEDLD